MVIIEKTFWVVGAESLHAKYLSLTEHDCLPLWYDYFIAMLVIGIIIIIVTITFVEIVPLHRKCVCTWRPLRDKKHPVSAWCCQFQQQQQQQHVINVVTDRRPRRLKAPPFMQKRIRPTLDTDYKDFSPFFFFLHWTLITVFSIILSLRFSFSGTLCICSYDEMNQLIVESGEFSRLNSAFYLEDNCTSVY